MFVFIDIEAADDKASDIVCNSGLDIITSMLQEARDDCRYLTIWSISSWSL